MVISNISTEKMFSNKERERADKLSRVWNFSGASITRENTAKELSYCVFGKIIKTRWAEMILVMEHTRA